MFWRKKKYIKNVIVKQIIREPFVVNLLEIHTIKVKYLKEEKN